MDDVVARFRAAHDEWVEANVANSKARTALHDAEAREDAANNEMKGARVALLSAALNGE